MIHEKGRDEVTRELADWISSTLGLDVVPGEDLVKGGKMDSYSTLLLINHISTTYEIDFDLESFDYEIFRSVDTIVDHMWILAARDPDAV